MTATESLHEIEKSNTNSQSTAVPQLRTQKTIRQPVCFQGIGLHTGEIVKMRFVPAPANSGIYFVRTDLPDHPRIAARLEYVQDTSGRSTTIGTAAIRIHTVEHVMAAIAAYDISNLCIELSNIEPPIANGSSDIFVQLIEEAGVATQEESECIYGLKSPIAWSHGDVHLVAVPHNGFKISYTLNYASCSLLKSQYQSFDITPETFKKEIAPCRTFARYEEISALIERGLIRGASLDNAVLIKDGAALSKGGLFFADEMVRHKILDMIGDLYLIGRPLHAHIIAIRSGHAENFAFAKELSKNIVALYLAEQSPRKLVEK